jgi:ribosomal protein S12 methylthiotransferase accessory factor
VASWAPAHPGGPLDGLCAARRFRNAPAHSALGRALRCAAQCGVTRLAEITRLDWTGAVVFQAIRPWSRALSAHQGKAFCAEDAALGALMEAVESDHVEGFDGETWHATFADLPLAERAPDLADFAAARGAVPDVAEPLAWTPARRILGGGRIWVPFETVCLDFTYWGDERLDRSSTGVGAHFTTEAADLVALFEVIERDAEQAWLTLAAPQRSALAIDVESIPFDWFGQLRRRLESGGLRIAVHQVPGVVDTPILLAVVDAQPGSGVAQPPVYGVAARSSAAEALARATLEALQTRLTQISGVRDSILYGPRRSPASPDGLTVPLSPRMRPLSWTRLEEGWSNVAVSPGDLARRLAAAGYPDAAVADLSRPDLPVRVTKAFVPGLGNLGRRRRRPAPAGSP